MMTFSEEGAAEDRYAKLSLSLPDQSMSLVTLANEGEEDGTSKQEEKENACKQIEEDNSPQKEEEDNTPRPTVSAWFKTKQ